MFIALKKIGKDRASHSCKHLGGNVSRITTINFRILYKYLIPEKNWSIHLSSVHFIMKSGFSLVKWSKIRIFIHVSEQSKYIDEKKFAQKWPQGCISLIGTIDKRHTRYVLTSVRNFNAYGPFVWAVHPRSSNLKQTF